jgi:magnesium transporter
VRNGEEPHPCPPWHEEPTQAREVTVPDDSIQSLDLDDVKDHVLAALEVDDAARLDVLLEPLHAGDIAELIARMPFAELRTAVYRYVPDELSGDVLDLVPESIREELVEDLTPTELVEAVSEMAPDDAADLVTELEPEAREALLRRIPTEQSETIRDLMRYPPQTAGGIMTPHFTALHAGMTAGQAIERLRTVADSDQEIIYYAYVVDDQDRLLGVLSLRDLMLARSHQPIEDCMETNVQSVNAITDQEEVARMFGRYNFIALPVVDNDRRLVGVVTVDDIIEVIRDEESEDVQKMVGAGGDERVDSPILLSLRRRMPWLQINLLTALCAASVVLVFERTIARLTVLAVLMPVCAGLAGNTGQQALAVVIRGVVLDQAASRRWTRILGRELLLSATNGLVLGLLTGLVVFVVSRNPVLAGLVATALFASMTTAGLAGGGIPLLMRRIGFDPAQGSTVILTAITDSVAFAFFLGLATLLAGWLRSAGR